MLNSYRNLNQNLLYSNEIVNLKSMIFNNATCLLSIKDKIKPFNVCKMRTIKVDDNGNIWFMSSRSSLKNSGVSNNSKVRLLYSNPENDTIISVAGTAILENNAIDIHQYWKHFPKRFYQGAPVEADVAFIKIVPKIAYSWNASSNKLVAIFNLYKQMATTTAIRSGVFLNLRIA